MELPDECAPSLYQDSDAGFVTLPQKKQLYRCCPRSCRHNFQPFSELSALLSRRLSLPRHLRIKPDGQRSTLLQRIDWRTVAKINCVNLWQRWTRVEDRRSTMAGLFLPPIQNSSNWTIATAIGKAVFELPLPGRKSEHRAAGSSMHCSSAKFILRTTVWKVGLRTYFPQRERPDHGHRELVPE